ncbi:MAG TPA: hypothetical protein VFL91_08295 [Thermomicrobiales bacterium]|nr:hypothetical protein [Thermomicrobiales bacterium]
MRQSAGSAQTDHAAPPPERFYTTGKVKALLRQYPDLLEDHVARPPEEAPSTHRENPYPPIENRLVERIDIDRALAGLDKFTRDCVWGYYVEGRTLEDLAGYKHARFATVRHAVIAGPLEMAIFLGYVPPERESPADSLRGHGRVRLWLHPSLTPEEDASCAR